MGGGDVFFSSIYFVISCRAWRTVAAWAVVVGLVLCYSTGLVGYLSFRDATDGDILDNFEGALASCFKLLVVVHLILYIPSEASGAGTLVYRVNHPGCF